MFRQLLHSYDRKLYNTTIFSTQGRCSHHPQNFEDHIFHSWEDIQRYVRQGGVTERELEECDTTHHHPEEKEERTEETD